MLLRRRWLQSSLPRVNGNVHVTRRCLLRCLELLIIVIRFTNDFMCAYICETKWMLRKRLGPESLTISYGLKWPLRSQHPRGCAFGYSCFVWPDTMMQMVRRPSAGFNLKSVEVVIMFDSINITDLWFGYFNGCFLNSLGSDMDTACLLNLMCLWYHSW